MDSIKLSVHERHETGNGPARRLRTQGLVPAVSYAKGKGSTPIVLSVEELKAAMTHGHNVILELDFGKGAKEQGGKAKARYAVVKELQFHPVKRYLQHVDLHEVDLAVEIESPVSVEAVGTAAGLADGGIMDWERREVIVRALPGDMPASLELDVSGLEIGHHLTVGALTAPAGVVIVDDPEAVLLAMIPPRVEQPAGEGAEGEGERVEPEVVGGQASAEGE
jgi:large subunit ribosomal protein L25